MTPEQKPSITRMVHYVGETMFQEDSTHFAAIITKVNEDDTIDIVFFGNNAVLFVNNIGYSEEHLPNTWHWPERV